MKDDISLAELAALLQDQFTYEELCKMSPEVEAEYKARLNHLIYVNGSELSTAEKGKALEDLVALLLEISGNIFSIVKNVRTHTNEIDEVITLNQNGKILLANGLIPQRLSFFLGECKNYRDNLSVTYVGKFYSLLQTTAITTGILFTYKGVTGSGWSCSSGLIKKIYLQREDEHRRTAIIVFNIDDFKSILDGHNFFEIIEAKLNELRLDTSVSSFIKPHPAENSLRSSKDS